MAKIFWLDVETTGTHPWKNDIIQLAYIVEKGQNIIGEGEILMRPFGDESTVDPEALRVNGRAMEQIFRLPAPQKSISDLQDILDFNVNKYDRSDKLVLAGYNINFDEQFLRNAFKKAGKSYFGSYFHWPKLDVASVVAEEILLKMNGGKPKNFKLKTVCEFMGIELDPHDALNDIRATRNLFKKLRMMA